MEYARFFLCLSGRFWVSANAYSTSQTKHPLAFSQSAIHVQIGILLLNPITVAIGLFTLFPASLYMPARKTLFSINSSALEEQSFIYNNLTLIL